MESERGRDVMTQVSEIQTRERVDVVRNARIQNLLEKKIGPVRGVRPSEQRRYIFPRVPSWQAHSSKFKCHDSSGGDLPLSAINDNFCDCSDGSDEQGPLHAVMDE